MRAAIYARYSSDLQSEASIDDQIRDCTSRVKTMGWSLSQIYSDAAMSGSSTIRPGYQAMLNDLRSGKFDIVVAEALDRVSRDQEDIAGFYKQLEFANAKLITLSEGEINEPHIGLKGTMNALFLKDLAAKIKRGQRGRVEAGRSPGGLSYGYKVRLEYDDQGMPIRGLRQINEDEAKVIRRIYSEYVEGKSPRLIASELNQDNIPAPKAKLWNASTINGNRARRNGILQNEAYIGMLVYNRTSMIKNPTTGKRVHRINPPDTWQIKEVPELRIISNELWDRAQTIKDTLSLRSTNKRRRPKRMLSGLITCGHCGGSFTIIGEDRFGCSKHRESGTCDNNRTISAIKLEDRVLQGVKSQLLTPEMLQEFTEAVRLELKNQVQTQDNKKDELNSELGSITKKLTKLVAAIEDGIYSPEIRSRIETLESRRQEIEAESKSLADTSKIRVIPNIPDFYRRQVENLRETLSLDESTRHEAIRIMRTLIDRIVIHKRPGRGNVAIEMYGALTTLTELAGLDNVATSDVMTMVVAEEGLEPPTRGL